jgi:hypothetical protein
MLTWVPSERKTARELTEHPFLNFGGQVPKEFLEKISWKDKDAS